MKALVQYLSQRSDSSAFLLPTDLGRTLDELFFQAVHLLPQPYTIYPADETQPSTLGFPVAESHAMKELELKLDRWLNEEVAWQLNRTPDAKDKAHA
ncbi:MAG TPA: hypothetical protein VFT12_02800, partial [Thermoanaerobaculia bacterium]|nr:hypothetical protein [Thermoanaerobaculia bacterium]